MATHQLELTSISDFFLLSEVAIMWQIDGAAYKLKPRSFYKAAYLQVHFVDFHPWCELCLTSSSYVPLPYFRIIE